MTKPKNKVVETEEGGTPGEPLTPVVPNESTPGAQDPGINEPGQTGKTENANAAINEVIGSKPQVNTQAVAHAQSKNPGELPPPPKNKGGRPVGFSPKKAAEEAARKAALLPGEVDVNDPMVIAKSRMNGKATADTMVLVARTLMGPEWGADDEAELEALREAYADTFQHYGWCNSPGWVPMVAASSAFVVKRVNRPKTADKLQSWKESIAAWWAKRSVRTKPSRQEHNKGEGPTPPEA